MDFLQYFIIRYRRNYTYSISYLCMISDLFMSIINVGTSDNSINTLHPPQCDMLLEDENISARTLADPEGGGFNYVFLISRFTLKSNITAVCNGR